MDRLVVGFDLDGVLADFAYVFGKMAGLPSQSAGAQEVWGKWPGLSRERTEVVWDRVALSGDVWTKPPPLVSEGEIAMMRDLVADGHKVVYVTNRGGVEPKEQTARWLAQYEFPQSGNVFVVEGGKLEVCLQQGVTHFIEDRPRNLLEFQEGRLDWLVDRKLEIGGIEYTQEPPDIYVRDWPYNRTPELDAVYRVSSVGEFIMEVRRG